MKKFFIVLIVLSCCITVHSQTFAYSFKNILTYQVSVLANYLIYVNNVYSGLVSHEYKSILDVKGISDDVFSSSGTSFCLTQMIYNGKIVGYKVDDIVKTDFWTYQDGVMSVIGDNVPYMRNIPIFKKGRLSQDEVYAGIGSYVPTLEWNGNTRRYVLPTTVSMQYSGTADIFGKKCDLFNSTFSMNSVQNYKDLKSVRGKHNLRVYFDNNMGMPVYIEDNFSDTFTVQDGSNDPITIRQEGFYLTFYEPYRRLRIHLTADDVQKQLNEDPDVSDNVYLREDNDGLAIVLNNLHFSPDSAQIMPQDYKIIFALAKILIKNKDKMVLITGHTADAGTPEEQMSLSFERAKAVADALVDQRVNGKQLMIDGKGAAQPVAPNDTPENMAKNRRVEIKILGK
ncbi:MAG: OmpA family protein [Spirochaetales bacterium]|nr:OmpA family protein [Spirochaetales bacterium]